MAQLTAERRTARRENRDVTDPMAANASIFKGGLVALDAAGNAVRASAALNLVARGLARETKVGGAVAGAAVVTSEVGVFRLGNSSAADAITRADIGKDCFIVDDQTVAKTNGGNTRPVAGKVVDVEAAGVWVSIGIR